MALLGGAAALGVAKKASAQQPSTLSNMPFASTPLSGAELTYVIQGGVSKKTGQSYEYPAGYQIPAYVGDMVTLLARLDAREVHWVGTSMGGLIGLASSRSFITCAP